MSENLAPVLARISTGVAELRAACERIERNQSDPAEVRQALSDVASGYSLITQMAEVLIVARNELLAFREWREARMSGPELRDQLEQLLFATEQLASISQGWRDDLLLMRSDIRRLATACEAMLAALKQHGSDDTVTDQAA